MPLLSDTFLEGILLAAGPAVADGSSSAATRAGETQRPSAHAVIGAALDDARRSGRRAAVCLVDLSASEGADRVGAGADAMHAALTGCLRRVDQHVRVGDALVVVAPGLDHPAEGDRLAERLRAAGATDARGAVVGMAMYPVHGRDATSLLDSARSSVLRARVARGLADGWALQAVS